MNKLGDEKERKIYEFIVRHFLACVSKDAQVCTLLYFLKLFIYISLFRDMKLLLRLT